MSFFKVPSVYCRGVTTCEPNHANPLPTHQGDLDAEDNEVQHHLSDVVATAAVANVAWQMKKCEASRRTRRCFGARWHEDPEPIAVPASNYLYIRSLNISSVTAPKTGKAKECGARPRQVPTSDGYLFSWPNLCFLFVPREKKRAEGVEGGERGRREQKTNIVCSPRRRMYSTGPLLQKFKRRTSG